MKDRLTKAEATKIVNAIYDSNFRVYGLGHFDVRRAEMVEILMIALNNENREVLLQEYYELLK